MTVLRIREIVDAFRRRWSPIVRPDPVLALHQKLRTLGEGDDFERVMSDWRTRTRTRRRGLGRRKSRR